MQQWFDVAFSVMGEWAPLSVQVLKIIWINILLSGDNAVVIAMACRALPPRQRMVGIMLGAGAAVLLRIFFTVILQYVLGLPWLRLVGGLLLVYIAVKLLTQNEEASEDSVAGSDNIWGAVKTVAIADMVMSLDNVLAIAGAAKGHPWLIVFGLVISIPMIVAGATLIMALLGRFPILVWAGAALLGWIAGELVMEDPVSHAFLVNLGNSINATSIATALCTPISVIMGLLAPLLAKAGLVSADFAVCKSIAPEKAMEYLMQLFGAVLVLGIGWIALKFASGHEKTAH